MKRRFRLTRSTDFKRVRRLGKSYAHPLVVLIVLFNDVGDSHVGVSAGRAVGGAVQRNRAKRLLRAAIQPLLMQLLPGWDMVLVARRPLADSNCNQTEAALLQLLQKARLLKASHG